MEFIQTCVILVFACSVVKISDAEHFPRSMLMTHTTYDVNDASCDDCKIVIKDLKKFLTSKEVLDAMEQIVIGAVCDSMGVMKPTCESLVKKYIPMLIQALYHEINAEELCKDAGICLTGGSLKFRPQISKHAQCPGLVKLTFKHLHDKEIVARTKQHMSTFCTIISWSSKVPCSEVIEDFIKKLSTIVTAKKICHNEKAHVMGPVKMAKPLPMHPEVLGPEKTVRPLHVSVIHSKAPVPKLMKSKECSFCSLIVSYAHHMLQVRGATVRDLEPAVDKACRLVNSPDLVNTCLSTVRTHGNHFVTLLNNGLTPNLVCNKVKMCGHNTMRLYSRIENGELCSYCTLIVLNLDTLLNAKSTKDVMKKELKKECSYLPSPVVNICQDMIDKHLGHMINMLIMKLSPDNICTAIRMCKNRRQSANGKAPPQLSSHDTKTVSIMPPHNGISCDLCMYVMSELDNLITKKSTEHEIEEAVKKVCSFLPASVKGECDSFIDTYFNVIVNLIVHGLSPSAVCEEIHLCSANLKTPPKLSSHNTKTVSIVPPHNDISCEVCTYAMSYLEHLITEKSTEEEIKKALKTLCSLLPQEIKGECDSIIGSYYDVIVKLILDGFKPSAICKEIQLCPDLFKLVKPGEYCDTCKNAVKEIGHFLQDAEVKKVIISRLNELCDVLPSQYTDVCKMLVYDYYDQAVMSLITKFDPLLVCKNFGLCGPKVSFKDLKKSIKGTMCFSCNFILNKMKMVLKSTSVKNVIMAYSTTLCDYSTKQNQSCRKLIEVNYDHFVNNIDDKRACKFIGFCKPTGLKVNPSFEYCEPCKLLVRRSVNLVGRPSYKNLFLKISRESCRFLPDEYMSLCKNNLNEKYYMEYLKAINKVQPERACQMAGLCFSSNQTFDVVKYFRSEICYACENAVFQLHRLLKQESTKKKIKEILLKICGQLPPKYSRECSSEINLYYDMVIDIVINDINYNAICKLIGVCAA